MTVVDGELATAAAAMTAAMAAVAQGLAGGAWSGPNGGPAEGWLRKVFVRVFSRQRTAPAGGCPPLPFDEDVNQEIVAVLEALASHPEDERWRDLMTELIVRAVADKADPVGTLRELAESAPRTPAPDPAGSPSTDLFSPRR